MSNDQEKLACDVTHIEPKIQAEKIFLRSQVEDLPNP